MDLGLEGKIALVTGGSRGLGKAIAGALAAEGAKVAICARNEAPLREAAEEIGGDLLAVAADVTVEDDQKRFLEAIRSRWGHPEILVHNVGGNRRGKVWETSDEDWNAILELNLTCHVRLSRMALGAMRDRGAGSILFVSSIFGREAGGPGLAIYNSTKSALISVAKIMALELAPDGIRVNSIAPGSIRFPGGSWDRRCQEQPEKMREFVATNIPMGRFGRAEEIGDVAAFLVSERAGWVTGACLNVDGGQSRSLI